MSATQDATCSAVGGSPARWRSCSRTEPMSIEWACSARPAVPSTSSVEPPPMSTTRTGSGAGPVRLRTAPSKASAASCSPVRMSGATPSRSSTPPHEHLAVAGVAHRGRGAQPDPGRAVAPGWWPRSRPAPRTSAPAPRPPAGRSRRRPGRAGRCATRAPRCAGRSPTSSRMVLVPQSIAATVSLIGVDTRSGRPPVAQLVEDLVAERVHATTLGESLRGQHVQALHAVGHAPGGDAVDLRDAAELALGPAR